MTRIAKPDGDQPNPVSILARLRNLARETHPNLPANAMLLLYAQQGLLARLESSRHSDHFVLKGALSLFVRFGNAARPTEDIDLAAHDLPNTPEGVLEVMREICAVRLDDGLEFSLNSSSARAINEQLAYPGVTLTITATLGPSRANFQVDVSFGNAITPEPVMLNFPPLVIPQSVRVRTYPLETVVAEKFAALAEIGEVTTRMKDIYDLHTIIGSQSFETQVMRLAFERSFAARGTPALAIAATLEESFSLSPTLARRWQQYLARNRFDAPAFPEVMGQIRGFIAPLLIDGRIDGHWIPNLGWAT